MKVAIVHDYLIQMGGAERVVASFHRAFPEAPIYTSIIDRNKIMQDFDHAVIHGSWMRFIPGINHFFKALFPLYPLAFRSFEPIKSDVILISSSGFANYIRGDAAAQTICYCHTPPRFLWDAEAYLQHENFSNSQKKIIRFFLNILRYFDFQAAQKIDHFIANSEFVRKRIKQHYNRDSTVIYPPVTMEPVAAPVPADPYYLIVARLVSYKRIDIAVQAFSRNGRTLIIVGEGPDKERLESLASPNVRITGWLEREQVTDHLNRCYALIVPGVEDFGITVIEAQACGKPVLAYGAGGALETVIDGKTGLFFAEQAVESLNSSLARFEAMHWDASTIKKNAARFSEKRFIEEMQGFVDKAVETKGLAESVKCPA